MNEFNSLSKRLPALAVETKEEKAPKARYAAPEMFAVGKSVDLIQGAKWRGPADHLNSWYIYDL